MPSHMGLDWATLAYAFDEGSRSMRLIMRGAARIDVTGHDPLSESTVVIDGNRIRALHGDATDAREHDTQVVDRRPGDGAHPLAAVQPSEERGFRYR